MKIKLIVIQTGLLLVSIPLLIILFNHLAEVVTPFIHDIGHAEVNSTDDFMHVLKEGIKYQNFRIKFIYFGALSGIIVGRSAYYMWKDKTCEPVN